VDSFNLQSISQLFSTMPSIVIPLLSLVLLALLDPVHSLTCNVAKGGQDYQDTSLMTCDAEHTLCGSIFIQAPIANLKVCSTIGCVSSAGLRQVPPTSIDTSVINYITFPIVVYGCNETTSLQSSPSATVCNTWASGDTRCTQNPVLSQYSEQQYIALADEINGGSSSVNLVTIVVPIAVGVLLIIGCIYFRYRKDITKPAMTYEKMREELEKQGVVNNQGTIVVDPTTKTPAISALKSNAGS
jgi:hypothetical protein